MTVTSQKSSPSTIANRRLHAKSLLLEELSEIAEEKKMLGVAFTRMKKPGTVLVVDDDPFVRRAVGRLLRAYKWDVVEACNGDEAEYILENAAERIDVVLTDWDMPLSGGAKVIRAATVPVVVMSGRHNIREKVSEAEDEFGKFVFEIIPKPFVTQDLITALSGAVADTKGVVSHG